MSRPPIQGELVVVALKAEKLEHKSPVKQDPFCVFRVGDVVKRTKADIGGGLYPIWDDQVNIHIVGGQHQLFVQVFDKTAEPHNLMADGVIDLATVFRDSEHDGYFPLLSNGRPGGVLYLELTFYSAMNHARPQQQVRYQRPPPPQQQPGYHPSQQQPGYHPPQQFRPQHRLPPFPPPHQHQQRPYNPQFNQMPPQQRPYGSGQHRPLPQPPTHQQHYPPPQMRPSNSMGTAQMNSSSMTAAPLLSSPYNPIPSQRPNPYPNNGYQQPPAGFRPPQHQQQQQLRPGYYPPQQQQQHRPMPSYNNNNGYPPY